MTPGLIDCHTHLVYGGNRVEEFEKRLCGVSYEEIARAGGGIQSTVDATRAATLDALVASAAVRAKRLDVRGSHHHRGEVRIRTRPRDRAAHARGGAGARARAAGVGHDDLPRACMPCRRNFASAAGVRERSLADPGSRRLPPPDSVDAVDAFCENIAFSLAETETFLRAAKNLGSARARACGPIERHGRGGVGGAVSRAVRRSSRVLERARRAGSRAGRHGRRLAARCLLHFASDDPAAGADAAPRRACRWRSRRTAIPAPRPCTSLLLALNMACTLFGLTPEESLGGATRHAARALGIGGRGRYARGRASAPILFCGTSSGPRSSSTRLAQILCVGVVHRGRSRSA